MNLQLLLQRPRLFCAVFFVFLSLAWQGFLGLAGYTALPTDELLQYYPWRYQVAQTRLGPLPSHRITASDTITQTYPKDAFLQSELRKGRIPLWDPYTLCGAPNVGNPAYPFYPPRLLAHALFSAPSAHQVLVLFHFVLLGWAVSALLLEQQLSLAAALLGGTAAALGGHAMAWAEFESTTASLGWAAFCLYQLERLSKGRRDSLGWIALGWALIILPGHAQYSAFGGALVATYALWLLPKNKTVTWSFASFLVGTAGASMLLAPLWSLMQIAGRPSFSAAEILTSSRLSATHLLSFINPEFLGTPQSKFFLASPKGMLSNPEEFWLFLGCIPLALALLGLRKAPYFSLVTALALLNAAGPLHYLLATLSSTAAKLVPGRSVAVASLCLAVLAGHGLQAWLDGKGRRVVPIAALGVSAATVLFVLLSADLKWSWYVRWTNNPGYDFAPNYGRLQEWNALLQQSVQAHFSWGNPSWWMTLTVAVLGIACLAGPPRRAAGYVLVGLSVGELLFFSHRLQHFSYQQTLFPRVPGIEYLLQQRPKDQRIAPILSGPRPSTLEPYLLPEIGGYTPLYPARISQFWERAADHPVQHVVAVLGWSAEYRRVVDLTSGALVYTDPIQPVLPPSEFGPPLYRLDLTVYANSQAMPRAYLSPHWVTSPDPQQALGKVFSAEFDPHRSLIVESERACPQQSQQAITPLPLVVDEPARVALDAETAQECYLVLSDTFCPGWVCLVDGQESRIEPANGMFRGVYLTPGRHRVEFDYRPGWYTPALSLTLLSLLLSMSMVWFGRRWESQA